MNGVHINKILAGHLHRFHKQLVKWLVGVQVYLNTSRTNTIRLEDAKVLFHGDSTRLCTLCGGFQIRNTVESYPLTLVARSNPASKLESFGLWMFCWSQNTALSILGLLTRRKERSSTGGVATSSSLSYLCSHCSFQVYTINSFHKLASADDHATLNSRKQSIQRWFHNNRDRLKAVIRRRRPKPLAC